MKKNTRVKIVLSVALLASLAGCDMVSKITEKKVEKKQSPVWLYYSTTPLDERLMDFSGGTASFVPDFVNYSTDWAKFGLRGAVSEISWGDKLLTEMRFSESGKLKYVGSWLDQHRKYGDPIGFNYNEEGRLRYMYNQRGIVSGSDLSRHSQHYEYDTSGKLISRGYGTYKKSYHYYENGNLKSVDFVPVKENLNYYYGSDDVYFTCDDQGNITTMERGMGMSTHFLYGGTRGKLHSSYIHGDDGLCVGRKDTYILKNNKIDSICSTEAYTYNEYGDLASWTHESTIYPSKKTACAFTLNFDYVYDEAENWVRKIVKGDMIEVYKSDFRWYGYGNVVKADDDTLQLECYRTIKYHTEMAMENYRKSQEQNKKTN